VLPQRSQPGDLLGLTRLLDRPFDERRSAVIDQLASDAIGGRPDARHSLERIRLDQRRNLAIESQHRLGGAFVAPPPLAVAGQRRHVEQQAAQLEVNVRHRH
jgi:hypothetical protein